MVFHVYYLFDLDWNFHHDNDEVESHGLFQILWQSAIPNRSSKSYNEAIISWSIFLDDKNHRTALVREGNMDEESNHICWMIEFI
jgi:hypothetical protein